MFGRILRRQKLFRSHFRNASLFGKEYKEDHMTNLTPRIINNLGNHKHRIPNHPIEIIKNEIYKYFDQSSTSFAKFEELSPIVTVEQNFDSVLIPKEHVSRDKKDNYYINEELLLRAHTSAHQVELLRKGESSFLCCGDVYRRDTMDRSHYPIFHQMEGPRKLFIRGSEKVENDLKRTLEGLVKHLFGENVEYRWMDEYFPFTHPSFEIEVFYEGDWLEILGCGIMEHRVLVNGKAEDKIGWAFGLGLERLAMRLFDIKDIRLFWKSEVVQEQFQNFTGDFRQFKFVLPERKIEPAKFDLAFWVPEGFHEHDFYDIARNIDVEDAIENVELIDVFTHPKTGKTSHCYRTFYRGALKGLQFKDVEHIDSAIRAALQEQGAGLR
ncbi:Oidioi.mRNA.OKI2018_I69.XSR.g14546.t1.cds [Oikopleura dioica]|uniref:phenylalanine--tRNA ligase n=1 Tax=Oikopleura dioica TaxID=34765 RepID=A0ABN7SF39_OIKDI|nr:Oidioi.mRNA.OKI2018_I69.XSR.g14546.t1.cds [Oikopleura dioica]